MSSLFRCALLHDGALTLSAERDSTPGLQYWLPRFPQLEQSRPSVAHAASCASIDVASAGAAITNEGQDPSGAMTFGLDSVKAYVDSVSAQVQLRCVSPSYQGHVDLRTLQVHLAVAAYDETVPGPSGRAAHELFTMLTMSSALLLGRLGRTLIHAAAVIDPEGRAWLLVGDTHAGKTTTTINIIRGGWQFLSDDHVVAFSDTHGRLAIEGWPRQFHVDAGWEQGEITGRRIGMEPSSFGPDRWRRTAPLGGILFPQVNRDVPTHLTPLSSGITLTRLLRQTPWLFADPEVAPTLLVLLKSMAALPAFSLSVGVDTYHNSDLLIERCLPLAGVPADATN